MVKNMVLKAGKCSELDVVAMDIVVPLRPRLSEVTFNYSTKIKPGIEVTQAYIFLQTLNTFCNYTSSPRLLALVRI